MEALFSVLPMLAYGDISQEAWQDLRAGDCIHFIQLAQRAVRYMLSEADAAHMSLVRRSAKQQWQCARPNASQHEVCCQSMFHPESIICISI